MASSEPSDYVSESSGDFCHALPNEFKLFCGGISWRSTNQSLRTHFEQFGHVTSVKIVMDRSTGKSRGYGFVTFGTPEARDMALARNDHFVDGRLVHTKPVTSKLATPALPPRHAEAYRAPSSTKEPVVEKVFVGGLSHSTTEEELVDYFGRFGSIIDSVVIRDRVTGTPRGFGFVTFDSVDAAARVLQHKFHSLCGKDVEVKPCDRPRPPAPAAMMGSPPRSSSPPPQPRPQQPSSYQSRAPSHAPSSDAYGQFALIAQQAAAAYFTALQYFSPPTGFTVGQQQPPQQGLDSFYAVSDVDYQYGHLSELGYPICAEGYWAVPDYGYVTGVEDYGAPTEFERSGSVQIQNWLEHGSRGRSPEAQEYSESFDRPTPAWTLPPETDYEQHAYGFQNMSVPAVLATGN